MSTSREDPSPGPGSASGEPLGAALRKRFGETVDPHITLGADDEDSAAPAVSTQLLKKLAIHSAAISRYEIKGEVARGGMGVVLKVWDQDLRRPLAMKVILGQDDVGSGPPSGEVGESQLTRFLEEAQITGQLDHPGIVPVHELGLDAEGRTFFTMRLVRGRDLKTLFARKEEEGETWPIARSVGIFLKICETMAYAHSKGVIHRDLKPANIMVGRFGETYVMDWGLAKVIGAGETGAPDGSGDLSFVETERRRTDPDSSRPHDLTLDGAVMGTPSFMPPEQARGQTERLGPWSDIYAVGAMLYQLLTGRAPYTTPGERTAPHALLAMVLSGPPPPIAELRPSIDPEIVSICEKAMARDVLERYQSMLEMAEDLQAYLEGRVVRAHDTSSLKAFTKLVRRNKGVATAIAAVILVGLSGVAAFVWQQGRTIRAVQAEQVRTVEARDEAIRNAALARRRTYVADLIAADASLRANEVEAVRSRLEECPPELRGWEWEHLRLRTDLGLAVLPHPEAVTTVAFSPDGSRLATGSADAVVRLFDPRTRAPLGTLAQHDGAITALAFGPDGTRLASASDDELVRVWDVAAGAVLLTLTGHDGAVTALAWSPDGAEIASGSADETIRVWNAATGELLDTLRGHEGSVSGVAFTADGRLLVSAGHDGRVQVWNASGRDLEGEPILEQETKINSLAASPDGRLVAFGGYDAGIHVWSLDSREQVFVLRGHTGPVTSVAFTPDGSELVSASADETVRLWSVESHAPLAVLRGHADEVLAVAVSADGTLLLSGGRDATARLWDPEIRESFQTLDCGASHVDVLAVSRDGQRIVAGSDHPRAVTIWDAASGTELLALAGAAGDRITAVACAPDGSWIVTGGFQDPSLFVLDARTGAVRLGPLAEHISSITALAVSPDGTRIVSGSDDGTARVWDAATGERLAVLEDDGLSILSAAFAPDESTVATGSLDGTIRLWDASAEAVRAVLEGHTDAVSSLDFDARSGRLVSGSDDGTVRIWTPGSEAGPVVLLGHTGPVVSVAFAPDGSRIVSGSHDGTLRIWSAETGESLLTLRGHELPVTAVAFGGDGTRIVSASFDRTVRVWETSPTAARHAARAGAAAVLEALAERGTAPGAARFEAARQRLGADARLDDAARREALRILDLRAP